MQTSSSRVGEHCYLFIPGNKDLNKLLGMTSSEYVAIYDLEDSVPKEEKDLARSNIEEIFESEAATLRGVRINSIRSDEGLKDLLVLKGVKYLPDIVEIPMVEHPEEANIVRSILSINRHGRCQVWCAIETPLSLDCIGELAKEFDGFIFGSGDLSALLGVDMTSQNLLYARMKMINSAKANGTVVIDTPCFELERDSQLKEESITSKEMGFNGKSAIHPSQVSIINEAFKPSRYEIDNAKKILNLIKLNNGKIIRYEGVMYGPPMAKRLSDLVKKYG